MSAGHRARRGFTLIEMLTVIAIIGVLAAMLFPVFTKARAQAQKTACASNLKQIGAAILCYAGDWDTRLPVAAAKPTVTPEQMRLMDALAPYTKSEALFICPEDDDYFETEGSSYGWVELFSGLKTTRPQFLGQDLSQVPCLLDAEPWHLGKSDGGGKNALWIDGHVKFIGQ